MGITPNTTKAVNGTSSTAEVAKLMKSTVGDIWNKTASITPLATITTLLNATWRVARLGQRKDQSVRFQKRMAKKNVTHNAAAAKVPMETEPKVVNGENGHRTAIIKICTPTAISNQCGRHAGTFTTLKSKNGAYKKQNEAANNPTEAITDCSL